jgi:hypothetical protein
MFDEILDKAAIELTLKPILNKPLLAIDSELE